jgi:hypothetical protein
LSDVLIINPSDDTAHTGLIYTSAYYRAAIDNNVGWFNYTKYGGRKTDLYRLGLMDAPGVHIGSQAYWFFGMELIKLILPTTSTFGNLEVDNLVVNKTLTSSVSLGNLIATKLTLDNTTDVNLWDNATGSIGFTSTIPTSLTGTYNTLIGMGTYRGTTGANNTAVGGLSGHINTTGGGNSLFGYAAGRTIDGGNDNTCIGASAADALTTQSSNVFVGAASGLNAACNYGTYMGYLAGRYAAGTGNTGIGYWSLVGPGSASAATYNAALGYESLKVAGAADFNVAVGCQAGVAVSSGDYNTLLGTSAGYALTTASNSTFLGYYAGKYETVGSKIIIDNLDRTNEAGQRIAAPFYAVTNATVTSQQVTLNGDVMLNGALNFGVDGGANDTYAVTIAGYSAYVTGSVIIFTANTLNTGACTINVNSLGAKDLKDQHDQDPEDSFIEAGSVIMAVYDGTNFQIMNPDANP